MENGDETLNDLTEGRRHIAMGFLKKKHDILDYVVKLALQLVDSEKRHNELKVRLETLERNLETISFGMHSLLDERNKKDAANQ